MVQFVKVFKDVKQFTVKRSQWYRGLGEVDSALLTNDGRKCCLGFYAEACGIPSIKLKREIPGPNQRLIFSPGEVNRTYSGYFWDSILIDKTRNGCSYVCGEMMETNDSTDLSDSEREIKLTSLFKSQGIKITFVD